MSQMPATEQPDVSAMSEPPKWPMVVGIISIVWGSLGVICNGCGALSPVLGNAMVNMVPPEQQEQMRQQMAASSSAPMIAVAVLSVLLSILLIVAGVMTLRRQAIGRPMHLGWAAIGTLTALAGVFFGWANAQAMQQQMPPGADATQAAAQQAGMVGGLVFGLCLSLIYPIFCLVWFGAMGKKPEVGAPRTDGLI